MSEIYILPDEISEKTKDALAERYLAIKEAGILMQKARGLPLRQVIETYEEMLREESPIWVYGRVVEIQDFGKLIFAKIRDGKEYIEIKTSPDIDKRCFDLWKEYVQCGDIVNVLGLPSLSRDGVPQIKALNFIFLNICGLGHFADSISISQGRRATRPHLQMFADPRAIVEKEVFSTMLSTVRSVMNNNGFKEQISPILFRSFHGGDSHPFVTFSRDLGINLYLRVTAEIALKMLLVGGLHKVYEIGPSFRNENQDKHHIIGFVLLEAYAAFMSIEDMISLLKGLLIQTLESIEANHGSYGFPKLVSRPTDISDFEEIAVQELLVRTVGVDISLQAHLDYLASLLGARQPATQDEKARLIYKALYKLAYPHLTRPTFIYDLPAGLSPFIAKDEENPDTLHRVFLVWNGLKIAEIYSSEINPLEITRKLEQQKEILWDIDPSVRRDYRDFMHAMYYGMPPVSVMDIGLERLLMLLLGKEDIRKLRPLY